MGLNEGLCAERNAADEDPIGIYRGLQFRRHMAHLLGVSAEDESFGTVACMPQEDHVPSCHDAVCVALHIRVVVARCHKGIEGDLLFCLQGGQIGESKQVRAQGVALSHARLRAQGCERTALSMHCPEVREDLWEGLSELLLL